jgi:multicomponent Na+:H+ antiporter subunit F
MKEFLTVFAITLLLLMLPVLFRLLRGPTIIDRMISVNIIGAKTTVLLIYIGTLYGRVEMFVDLAMTYALLNFLGSLASARFIQRRKTSVPGEVCYIGEAAND